MRHSLRGSLVVTATDLAVIQVAYEIRTLLHAVLSKASPYIMPWRYDSPISSQVPPPQGRMIKGTFPPTKRPMLFPCRDRGPR
jgi:hypothetical protein